MLWALVFVTVTAGFVVSHMVFMAARRGERDARYNRAAMAETFARSGVQDAVGWFHQRSSQPITVFDPQNDPSSDPPRNETIDPALGLVREFEISGSLWGRYEVRRESVADISSQRGDLVPGSVWEVGVRAFVYRRRDAARSFNEEPNQLIGTKAMTSEIRWLQVNPPAPAALCADDPSQVQIGANASIDGGAAVAIAYRDAAAIDPPPATTTPTFATGATVAGMPTVLPTAIYEADAERVFAMRLDELRSYSDATLDIDVGGAAGGRSFAQFLAWLRSLFGGSIATSATTPVDATPDVLGKLIVARGLQLAGDFRVKNSLLVVDGDLTTAAGQHTQISGIVYVTGNAVLDKGEFELDGTMIVRGRVNLGSGAINRVTLHYDAAAIEQLRRTVGKYRPQRGRNPGQ